MKKAAVPSTLVAVVLLVLGVTAEAQQPKKVPQIGHLTPVSLSAMASRYEAFRQGPVSYTHLTLPTIYSV